MEQGMVKLRLYNTKEMVLFRTPKSVNEMDKWCSSHSHIWFASVQGDARRAKVNGAVRRWKRDRNRIEVPVKYGLYEYGTFTAADRNRILIPVEEVK